MSLSSSTIFPITLLVKLMSIASCHLVDIRCFLLTSILWEACREAQHLRSHKKGWAKFALISKGSLEGSWEVLFFQIEIIDLTFCTLCTYIVIVVRLDKLISKTQVAQSLTQRESRNAANFQCNVNVQMQCPILCLSVRLSQRNSINILLFLHSLQ